MENSGYTLKQVAVFIVFATLVIGVKAQDSTKFVTNKKPKHEIGVDVTTFIKYYINFSEYNNLTYEQNYFLTYRYFIGNSSIRAAFAVTHFEDDYVGNSTSSIYSETPLNDYNKSIRIRLGYEWIKELSTRWQFYYGIDAYWGKENVQDATVDYFQNYTVGRVIKVENFGGGPILGLRFKLNKRLSLIAESTFYFNQQEMKYYDFYTPQVTGIAPKDNSNTRTRKETNLQYTNPLSLILTVNF